MPRSRAAALLLLVAAGLACREPRATPRSVLLVTVDTLRADHCSLHGYTRRTTPELEALGKRAVVYEQATATASYTQGSVGSILTGLYPFEHGAAAHPSKVRADVETLAEALQGRGYRTAAVVTNPILRPEHGYDQGFTTYRFEKLQLDEGKRPVLRAAERTTDLGLELLQELEPPFFLWVHYMDPHWLYTPPAPFDAAFGAPGPAWSALSEGTLRGDPPIDRVYFGPQPAEIASWGEAAYDGEIAYTDQQIGRLLRGLDSRALAEQTLVVVTADHGESMGEHGIRFCHGFFTYEDNLRVPLIVAPPLADAERDQRIRDPFSLVDLKPLILARLGFGPPIQAQRPLIGESEPLYASAQRPNIPGRPRAEVLGEPGKWRSIRRGSLKLVVVPRQSGPALELYDLAADPSESHDLAGTMPAERDALYGELLRAIPASCAPPAAQAGVDAPPPPPPPPPPSPPPSTPASTPAPAAAPAAEVEPR